MLVSELVRMSNDWQRQNRRLQGETRIQNIVGGSAKLWDKLSDQQKQGCAREAMFRRGSSAEAILEQQQYVHSKMLILEEQMQRSGGGRPPVSMSGSKLSQAKVDELSTAWENFGRTRAAVEEALRKNMQAPEPDTALHTPLKKVRVADAEGAGHGDSPWWMSSVLAHRDTFVNSVWGFRIDDATTWFKLVLMVKNPQLMSFAPLEWAEQEAIAPCAISGADWEDNVMASWKHQWVIQHGEYVWVGRSSARWPPRRCHS